MSFAAAKPRLCSAIAAPAAFKVGRMRVRWFSDVLRAIGGWPLLGPCFVSLSSTMSKRTLNASSSLSSFFS